MPLIPVLGRHTGRLEITDRLWLLSMFTVSPGLYLKMGEGESMCGYILHISKPSSGGPRL